MVEFFHIMHYYTGRLETILDKYPIVMEIFTLFLRTLLMKMGIYHAVDYLCPLDTDRALTHILDYFNIPFTINRKMYLIPVGDLFLYVNDEDSSYVFGHLIMQKTKDEKIKVANPEEKLKNWVKSEDSFIFENNEMSRKSANIPPTLSKQSIDIKQLLEQKKRISHDNNIKIIKKGKEESQSHEENSRNSFNFSLKTNDAKKKISGNRTSHNISTPSTDVNDFKELSHCNLSKNGKTYHRQEDEILEKEGYDEYDC